MMKSWKRTTLALSTLIALLAVTGCAKPAVGTAVSNNSEVLVEELFDVDGCKVLRFKDAGKFHYFANCARSSTVMENQTESCGKNCYRDVEYQTTTNYR